MSAGLTRRTIVASAVVALAVGASFAILAGAMVDFRAAARREARTEQSIAVANLVERLVLDLETGLRGYVITGDDQFLAPWQAARTVFPEEAAALRRLAADSPEQSATAQRIVDAGSSYIEQYGVPLIEVARRDPAAARSVAATVEGKRRVDAMRAEFDRFLSVEHATSARRHRASEDNARRAMWGATAGLVLSLAVIAIFTRYLTVAIVRPIRAAARLAARFAAGDLSARMPETGTAEIGELERAFNVMGRSLETGRAELASSRARIVAASDEARRRIERDLHDGVQQRLVSLGLELRAAEAAVPADQVAVRSELSHVAVELGEIVSDLRELSRGIHPAILSQGGLQPAVATLARRSAVPVELSVAIGGRLPPPVEVAAYYVVSEALTNAAKHARASVVRLRVEVADGALHLRIVDDGVGGARRSGGSGLVGLADRVEALGGTIDVDSPAGAGTSIDVRLPFAGADAALSGVESGA